MNTERLKEAFDTAMQAVVQAKAELLKTFYTTPNPKDRTKAWIDQIDAKAERTIREHLFAYNDHFGFRGEEEPQYNRPPKDKESPFWLLDPNDGSSGFVEGKRGTSISLGLVDQQTGLPIMGIVWAYQAPNDHGDLFTWYQGQEGVYRNGQLIKVEWEEVLSDRCVIGVSAYADESSESNFQLIAPARYRTAVGIAYRLALCAVGECDIACSISGTRDFDTAAGHALIIGQGGKVVDEEGISIVYDPIKMTRAKQCFAGSPNLLAALLPLIKERKIAIFADPLVAGHLEPLKGKSMALYEGLELTHIQGLFWLYGALKGWTWLSKQMSAMRKLIIDRIHTQPTQPTQPTHPTHPTQPTDLHNNHTISENAEWADLLQLFQSIKSIYRTDGISKSKAFEQASVLVESWLTDVQATTLTRSNLPDQTREKTAKLLDFWYKGRHQLTTALVRRIKSERVGAKAEWLVDIDEISEYLWYIL
jgi:fructose-1,6-bisphosphatase/inositol monophosphatase family enzyme